MRSTERANNEIRHIEILRDYTKHAEGSVLIKCGDTHVICNASIEEKVPSFLKGKGQGWVTAEYGMLPRSTSTRMSRESARGKQSGRTQEIQRLIGRSMRAAVDLQALGERQILIDCDVINADGGTRTAAITGSYVALHLAIRSLIDRKLLRKNPLIAQIAAISCGIYKGEAVVDLDYDEDSSAEVDANFVFNQKGNLIEIQGTGEEGDFTTEQLMEMLALAKNAANELFAVQNKILMGV